MSFNILVKSKKFVMSCFLVMINTIKGCVRTPILGMRNVHVIGCGAVSVL